MIPPPLPSNSTYTSCWCEENIYLLCQNFVEDQSLKDLWEMFAVFISNSDKTVSGHNFVYDLSQWQLTCMRCFVKVALWYQKAAQIDRNPVIWDYHVVLLLRPRQGVEEGIEKDRTGSWVYDFDTTLPVPCPGQGKSLFSLVEKKIVEVTFSLFHHDVSIERCVPIWKVFVQVAKWYQWLIDVFSKFRVVPVDQFLQYFASDRSHMVCFQLIVYYDCWTIWSW